MKARIFGIIFLTAGLFCLGIYPAYCAGHAVGPQPQTKSVDVNKDGKPDVVYYGEGKYVRKVEADTNFDSKPDIVVHTKDGKFDSADVDTDYNGTYDKKFTSQTEFIKWINQKRPDFIGPLGIHDWQMDLIKF